MHIIVFPKTKSDFYKTDTLEGTKKSHFCTFLECRAFTQVVMMVALSRYESVTLL